MQLMFIITTGDGWTDTMQGMISEAPEWKWVLILYFTTFTIIMAFMLIELFVMVVCEAFEVLRHVLSTTTLLLFLPRLLDATIYGHDHNDDLHPLSLLSPSPAMTTARTSRALSFPST